jgi:hypothetical protein
MKKKIKHTLAVVMMCANKFHAMTKDIFEQTERLNGTLVPPGKCQDNISNWATTAFFHSFHATYSALLMESLNKV